PVSLASPPRSSSPFFFPCPRPLRALHSFPTRRSSDLIRSDGPPRVALGTDVPSRTDHVVASPLRLARHRGRLVQRRKGNPIGSPDRKSTRLNSSHVKISYAVFCLKKKTTRSQALALPG